MFIVWETELSCIPSLEHPGVPEQGYIPGTMDIEGPWAHLGHSREEVVSQSFLSTVPAGEHSQNHSSLRLAKALNLPLVISTG